MSQDQLSSILEKLHDSVSIKDGQPVIHDVPRLQATIHNLTEISSLGTGPMAGMARYATRLIALAYGAIPSSIHDLYIARGQGEVPNTFTVPAINLRILSFEAARAVFRVAKRLNAGAFIFEIARSEIGYTDQRPAEYATNVLAAAITEGYQGPIFLQGDHFQVSAKRFADEPAKELQAVRDLTNEAILSGFFNIDIDTSTLVDIDQPTVPQQQELNADLSAMFTHFIRDKEPKGITVSIGGEIGEVGGHNSTEEELRAYMNSYLRNLEDKATGIKGLSKISIQTGTSHGGVVLPDGSIAEVNVDFDTLLNLSRIARKEFGMGGAVQHGASTLPEDAFGRFVESEACEVHLATNFQNMAFERIPEELLAEMYAYLDENRASDRKPNTTNEQFYYKTRKYAIGPFKKETWNLSGEKKAEIGNAWEDQFHRLFNLLNIENTREFVQKTVNPVKVQPDIKFYIGKVSEQEDVSDLAD